MKPKRIIKAVGIFFSVLLLCAIIYMIRPECIIYSLTHLYCPACGVQRMTDSLYRLDFSQAFRFNPYMIIVLPIMFIFALIEAYRYVEGKKQLIASKGGQIFLAAIAASSIIFMLIRNI